MPAAVIPFPSAGQDHAARRATWSLLEIVRPGHSPESLGVLFLDAEDGRFLLRLREESGFEGLEEDESDYLAALAADLETKGNESGGAALLDSLEASLSGFLRIGDRTPIEYAGSAAQAVDRLYTEYVDSEVRPFVTHLPLYGLRAAATKFGEEFDQAEISEPERWLHAPRGLRLTQGMFAAQVVGRSMEPVIPDGSYCIFRAPVTGTRQGKLLLIEQTHSSDPAGRYTVKRYTSRKIQNPDGTWGYDSIRLEPLNREFEAFELGEGDFKVIAEFVQVLN